MKKRSLVSAIAMLVVSAIVLTSATFAWFVAGDKATVDQIYATVSNADGSIYISADRNDEDGWTTSLSLSDLTAVQTNIFPANKTPVGEGEAAIDHYELSPVSVNSDGKVVGGSLKQSTNEGETYATFTPANANGQYIKFTVYVKSDLKGTVNVTPTFTGMTNYTFAAYSIDNTNYTIYNDKIVKPAEGVTPVTNSYRPFISNDTSAVDYDEDAIISATETDGTTTKDYEGLLGGEITPVDNMDVTLNFTTGGDTDVKELTYLLWVEGQHPECKGNANANFSMSLLFKKPTTN